MTARKQLEAAKIERDRVPLGDYAGFRRAQQRVHDLYMAVARS